MEMSKKEIIVMGGAAVAGAILLGVQSIQKSQKKMKKSAEDHKEEHKKIGNLIEKLDKRVTRLEKKEATNEEATNEEATNVKEEIQNPVITEKIKEEVEEKINEEQKKK